MIRDVFYYGKKPNAHPREKQATDLAHARELATTEHFWIINEYCDYKDFDWDFDFEFLPDEDVWATSHNNVWPSYTTKDSGTWLCSKEHSDIIIYRADVEPLKYKPFPQYYIETNLHALVLEHPNEIFWALNKNINYSNFDFTWLPNDEQSYNISVFGSPESDTTHTYFVNAKRYMEGRRDFEFIDNKKLDEEYLSTLFEPPDMFYVDRGNSHSMERYNNLKLRFPKLQKTRYVNSWVDTINRCTNKSNTDLFWVLDSTLDYSNFDFKYYPNPWQLSMVHVFGTQYSHWGTTYLVNKNTFSNDTKYIDIIEHLPNLNFVKNKRTFASECLNEVILIDHGNSHVDNVLTTIKSKVDKTITIVKYENSYFDTIKNVIDLLPNIKEQFVWVCSSICDYTDFDFNYITDPFSKDQVHVFPSGNQKYGDTFLLNVDYIRDSIKGYTKLEDYKINFNSHVKTKRYAPPIISCSTDNHLCGLLREFKFPYAEFRTMDSLDLECNINDDIILWTKESQNIVVSSTGASIIFVPKIAVKEINKEFYDYKNISKANIVVKSKPLDIVFLSNGESCADENYEHLLKVTNGLGNRVVRVDGVNGRANAYHAALEASKTPWAFTVFAKLKVDDKFDFGWQPDRLQEPKHYIFYATNPVNGLVYGHQAMIAYNKKMTLVNRGIGLDFTLDDLHEVVPINSGIATYNTDMYSTWRTAFRESIKLCTMTDAISKNRLDTWLNVGNGQYGEYSILGAKHGVEYYNQVNGDINKLKLSYEWEWLQEKYKQLLIYENTNN